MPIIKDPRERAARAQEKRHTLLRFLRDELYTTPAVAAEVIGTGQRAARQTIVALEAAGYIKRHRIPLVPTLPPLVLIGITPSGQSMAFDPASENVIDRSFEPARFSLTYLRHTLDTQLLRVAAQRAGVTAWINADRLAATKAGVKKPDAVCIDLAGRRVAVEVERSIKGQKSYADVLGGHLTAIHQKKWQRVIWSSPDAETRDRVRALVLGVNRVLVAGVDTRIESAQHHTNLMFTVHQMFTDCLA
jgi:hypothetical protein